MAVIKFRKKGEIKAVHSASSVIVDPAAPNSDCFDPDEKTDPPHEMPGSVEHILALVKADIARRRILNV